MMMIFTAMRNPETGDFSTRQQCGEEDFKSTLAIISILVRHATSIIAQLPTEVQTPKRQNKKEKLFDQLPEKFTNREFSELGKNLFIPESTAKRYMALFCDKGLVTRESHGNYIKVTVHKTNDKNWILYE